MQLMQSSGCLRLTLLAPDIVEATLNGQAADLSLPRLLEPFPLEWDAQRAAPARAPPHGSVKGERGNPSRRLRWLNATEAYTQESAQHRCRMTLRIGNNLTRNFCPAVGRDPGDTCELSSDTSIENVNEANRQAIRRRSQCR